ncbi:MAG TPA: ATPase, partial [Cyclobacteriaceae bacterium]|nr:ATPase [Cyclobacteriaceae bacterium]
RKFKVEINKSEEATFKALKVPAWLWNSYEWSSFTNASGKTQRPVLRRALREIRAGETSGVSDFQATTRSYLLGCLASVKTDLSVVSNYKDESTKFGKKLISILEDCDSLEDKSDKEILKTAIKGLKKEIKKITDARWSSFKNKQGETVEFYGAFSSEDLANCISSLEKAIEPFGGISKITNLSEDTPIPFNVELLPDHIERLARESNVVQFLDFLVMRLRSMMADPRMNKIIVDDKITLGDWIDEIASGISIIDLSLVPSDISHLVVSVISRIIFEALQRYRRIHDKLLPTVIVMEEAHNFIRREKGEDEITPAQLCAESFEKIAREGRKFGLSLTLSSQRPSELSPTVLSQCNTFLLHRLVNDRDQELVKRLVPDNIGGLLDELPMLPTKKGILLGWASPIPVLVEMNDLAKAYRPKSDDPDFWDAWTNSTNASESLSSVVDDWQGRVTKNARSSNTSASKAKQDKKK